MKRETTRWVSWRRINIRYQFVSSFVTFSQKLFLNFLFCDDGIKEASIATLEDLMKSEICPAPEMIPSVSVSQKFKMEFRFF